MNSRRATASSGTLTRFALKLEQLAADPGSHPISIPSNNRELVRNRLFADPRRLTRGPIAATHLV